MDKKTGIWIALGVALAGYMLMVAGVRMVSRVSPEQRQAIQARQETARAERDAAREQERQERAAERERQRAEQEAQREQEEEDRWAADVEKQPERMSLINRLIDRGVFRKVEFGETRATVWVDSTFYALDFHYKESFSSVVRAYLITDTRLEMSDVHFRDSQTGKVVAQHTYFRGFRMN